MPTNIEQIVRILSRLLDHVKAKETIEQGLGRGYNINSETFAAELRSRIAKILQRLSLPGSWDIDR